MGKCITKLQKYFTKANGMEKLTGNQVKTQNRVFKVKALNPGTKS